MGAIAAVGRSYTSLGGGDRAVLLTPLSNHSASGADSTGRSYTSILKWIASDAPGDSARPRPIVPSPLISAESRRINVSSP
jgi:hypothetical protein